MRVMSEARMDSFRANVNSIRVEEWDDELPSPLQLDELGGRIGFVRERLTEMRPAEREQVAASILELERKESMLATLRSLVELAGSVILADHAISDLLESIDVANGLDPFLPSSDSQLDPIATPSRPLLPLDEARTNAISSVDAVREKAATITDIRSAVQLIRLEGILAEMLELADDAALPRTPVIFEHFVDSSRPQLRSRSVSGSSSRPPSSRASSRLSLLSTTEESAGEEGTRTRKISGGSHLSAPSTARALLTPSPSNSRHPLSRPNGTLANPSSKSSGSAIGIGKPSLLSRSASSSSTTALVIPRSSRSASTPSPRLNRSVPASIGSMGRPRASLASGEGRKGGAEGEEVVKFVPRRKDRVVDIEVARILTENSVSLLVSSLVPHALKRLDDSWESRSKPQTTRTTFLGNTGSATKSHGCTSFGFCGRAQRWCASVVDGWSSACTFPLLFPFRRPDDFCADSSRSIIQRRRSSLPPPRSIRSLHRSPSLPSIRAGHPTPRSPHRIRLIRSPPLLRVKCFTRSHLRRRMALSLLRRRAERFIQFHLPLRIRPFGIGSRSAVPRGYQDGGRDRVDGGRVV